MKSSPERQGFHSVVTFINSGNIIFEGDITAELAGNNENNWRAN